MKNSTIAIILAYICMVFEAIPVVLYLHVGLLNQVQYIVMSGAIWVFGVFYIISAIIYMRKEKVKG